MHLYGSISLSRSFVSKAMSRRHLLGRYAECSRPLLGRPVCPVSGVGVLGRVSLSGGDERPHFALCIGACLS